MADDPAGIVSTASGRSKFLCRSGSFAPGCFARRTVLHNKALGPDGAYPCVPRLAPVTAIRPGSGELGAPSPQQLVKAARGYEVTRRLPGRETDLIFDTFIGLDNHADGLLIVLLTANMLPQQRRIGIVTST